MRPTLRQWMHAVTWRQLLSRLVRSTALPCELNSPKPRDTASAPGDSRSWSRWHQGHPSTWATRRGVAAWPSAWCFFLVVGCWVLPWRPDRAAPSACSLHSERSATRSKMVRAAARSRFSESLISRPTVPSFRESPGPGAMVLRTRRRQGRNTTPPNGARRRIHIDALRAANLIAEHCPPGGASTAEGGCAMRHVITRERFGVNTPLKFLPSTHR